MIEEIFYCANCNKIFENREQMHKVHYEKNNQLHDYEKYRIAKIITIAETPVVLIYYDQSYQDYIYSNNMVVSLRTIEQDDKIYKLYKIVQGEYLIGQFVKIEAKK